MITHAAILADQLTTKAVLAAYSCDPKFVLKIEEAVEWAGIGRPLTRWAMAFGESASTLETNEFVKILFTTVLRPLFQWLIL
jgi:hypothetical protein